MAVRLRPLSDQVVVITGASSGIGLETARMAARAGARVHLIARNGEALAAIVAEIEQAGGAASFAVADVGDRAALAAAAAIAVERFGRIDTWVNDAGVAIYAALLATPLAEHKRLFRTNYFGVVNGAQVAVDYLRRRGGALITVGSIAGDMPSPVMGAYAASKHAVKGFIESLRIELNAGRAPIAVTLIKPAGIDTPIAKHAANHILGEALIPPPAYDPKLVARAILDAAEHPRLNVTVGGVGRLQVLAATHFPRLFARFGGLTAPLLVERDEPSISENALAVPGEDGRIHSHLQSGRTFSLYAPASRHPGWIGLGFAVLVGAGATLYARRRKTPN